MSRVSERGKLRPCWILSRRQLQLLRGNVVLPEQCGSAHVRSQLAMCLRVKSQEGHACPGQCGFAHMS